MAQETHQVEHAHEGGHASLRTYVVIGVILTVVTAIEVDKFGLGSKISFSGHDTASFYVQEKPHEIFERQATEVRGSGKR